MGFVWQMNRSINLIRWTVPSTAHRCSPAAYRYRTMIIAETMFLSSSFLFRLLLNQRLRLSFRRPKLWNEWCIVVMLTEWAHGSFYIAVPYRRHHSVDNLLCNRTRYWTFVRSSASYSVFSFFGCLRSTKRPSNVHCRDPIKLYDFFMYFIGQVSATVVLSALWPLFILIAHMILVFFRLLCSPWPWPLLRLRWKDARVFVCHMCAAHIDQKTQNRQIEYMNIFYSNKNRNRIVHRARQLHCSAHVTRIDALFRISILFRTQWCTVDRSSVTTTNAK